MSHIDAKTDVKTIDVEEFREDLAAATEKLQSLLDAQNIDSEELIKEAQELRRQDRHSKHG